MIPQAPHYWWLHTCGRCGVRVRRRRQHANAAWYKRHGLEPHAFPMTWIDRGGNQDCMSIAAMRERHEMGWPRNNYGADSRHYANTDMRGETS